MIARRRALEVISLALLSACESAVARLRGRKLTRLARADQVPAGGALRLPRDEDPLILVDDGGDIRGFLAVCTHEGCPLGWNSAQRLIRCPCHGSAFDTQGRVVNGPAKLPLTPVETIVERGEIFLISNS